MIKRIFTGKIRHAQGGNRFDLDDRAAYEFFINQFDVMEKEKDMQIEMRPKYVKRTQGEPGEVTNFNGYWWACIVSPIADEWGEMDHDDVHEMILKQVGHYSVDRFGEKHAKETKNLSGGEFSELCQRTRMWAAIPGNVCELGFRIMEPNEVDTES